MSGRSSPPRRLSLQHRLTGDYMRMAGRRSNVHGVVELDVTEARRRIRSVEAETGERLSFTAFLVSCLSTAIEAQPEVQVYRDWRGRIHRFEDVDVNVLTERSVGEERLGVPHVIRAANRRSLRSIHEEIRRVQEQPGTDEGSRWTSLFQRLPGVLRRQIWRLPQWFPRRWKQLAGTVAVTSVGMFGSGGGWAIAPTNYTLQLTVGGIETKPREVGGELSSRELLSLTVTFDHDVVDGGRAARFVECLANLVENAHGLDVETGD